MNTIHDKIPAYGMPTLEGAVNKPEKVSAMPGGPMPGGMPGMPEGMPGMGGPMPGGMPGMPEGMPGMGGPMPGGMPMPGGPGGGMPDLSFLEGIPIPGGVDPNPEPHPPTCRPSEHPYSVPGADLEPGKPGPGFPGGGAPKSPPFPRMDSIDVLNGKLYLAENPYAEISGEITDSAMTGGSYKTDEVCLNGVYIGGNSDYTIKDSTFDLTGWGIDDFAGNGSAVMAADHAKVTVENTEITTRGAIRPCTVASGESTLIVRNSVLDSRGGEIPAGYVPRIGSGMMEPPPGLKLGGNCRTHLSMSNSKAYFYDSKIIAHSWAALSTDSSGGELYLEANNCDVVCETVGYGTYADGGCHNVLNDCRVTVDTHVAIISGDAWVKLNGCTVKSNQYGCMIHAIRGHHSEVTEAHIVGGDWDVGEAVFFVKSENAYLKLDGAKVKTGKYLIHSVVNDDDMATKVPEYMKCRVYGVNAVLANGDYTGDIIHDDTDRTLNVTVLNASLTGVITDAYVSLADSRWTATGDSAVCFVGDVKAGQVDAPAGVVITAMAGEGCGLDGEYALASGGKLIVKQ